MAFTLLLGDCDNSDMEAEASRLNALLKNQLDFYYDIKKLPRIFLLFRTYWNDARTVWQTYRCDF